MKPKRLPPNDPREWIRRARCNLAHAEAVTSGIDWADLCFDSQQAAEKAVKAVFLHRRIAFPYVHNIAELLRLLNLAGQKIPKYVLKAETLSKYAVSTRYPGLDAPVTRREYRAAIRIAKVVVDWSEKQISRKSLA